MPGGLTPAGVLWALLSVVATVFIVGGVLAPEWLVGNLKGSDGVTVTAYFGAYKRCNYPVFDEKSRQVGLVSECGRYESFAAVPSIFWQLAILCAAAGASLSMLLSLLLVPSICMHDVVSKSTALVVGLFQLVAGSFIAGALILYPLGWDNAEVRDACGTRANKFILGHCHLGRAYMALVVGCAVLVFCALLSLCGGKRKPRKSQHPALIRGYDDSRLDTAQ